MKHTGRLEVRVPKRIPTQTERWVPRHPIERDTLSRRVHIASKATQPPPRIERPCTARYPLYAVSTPITPSSSVEHFRKLKHMTVRYPESNPFSESLLQEFEKRLAQIGIDKNAERSAYNLEMLFKMPHFQGIIHNLLYLDLRGNYINDRALGVIADHCPHIHCLWLASNLITTQGLFDHLNKFTGLHKLGLENNFGPDREGIDTKGYQLILAYARKHPSLRELALRVPFSYDQKLHDEFMSLPEETQRRIRLV